MFLKDPFTGNPSLAFTLFAAECEGDIPTYQGKRNKLIKDLRQRAQWSLISETDVADEAIAAGLGILTDEEIQNILQEVRGY